MNAKKRLLVLFVVVMVLSLATVSAFADEYSDDIPSDAVVYGAGTCRIGFTTSRYLSKGSGWNSTIHVSSTYVLWDDWWDAYAFEIVQAKNGNVSLSDQEWVYTGRYIPNPTGTIENASTNKSDYLPCVETIELYSKAANYTKIYLRIDKPSIENYLNDSDEIDNMKVWGYFWK